MADKDFVVKNGLFVNGSILVVNTGSSSVGINTSTPDANLKVIGTANITGNVAITANLTVTGTMIGTANNANFLGGVAAALYVNTSTISTLTANNALYLGGLAAAGYQTTAGLSANVATLTANNTLYLGGLAAAGYQTTAGLSANVAALTANATTYILGGGSLTTNTITFGTAVYFVANGNVGFGLNTPGYKIDVAGAINATGDITSSSDLRLKVNIEKIEDALNKVMKLHGVTFYKHGESNKSTGLIAQDVREVLPEAVKEKDGYLSVAYGNMMGLLVEAIKELKQEVDKLKHVD